MSPLVSVRPEMLRWAYERSRLARDTLHDRFPHLEAWERGELRPTFKQLEDFATANHTSVGLLLLSEPLDEPLPIPDFRTIADKSIPRPSSNLLDTIYLCQQRQAWYRDEAHHKDAEALRFVKSARVDDGVEVVAERMRITLTFDPEERRRFPSWSEAWRRFRNQASDIGVLVMANSIVANNTHRMLKVDEFRGFALVDELAPLVFINGADATAAKIFTLAHELAHIWVGESGLSDSSDRELPDHDIESFCNRVAAEVLAPLALVDREFHPTATLREELQRLARIFKVSRFVILRRIRDLDLIDEDRYWSEYDRERSIEFPKQSGGATDPARTAISRAGERFTRAVVVATLEGRSSFTDASRLLECPSAKTFERIRTRLGLAQ